MGHDGPQNKKHAEERGSLYLEVCVIDAFKDQRWSSGLYSHHREERGKGSVREKESDKDRNKGKSSMWLIPDQNTDSTTTLTCWKRTGPKRNLK